MNKLLFCLFLLICLNIAPVKAQYSIDDNIAADNLVNTTLKGLDIEKPYSHLKYNYEDLTTIPIRISIKDRIKSEQDLYEGQIVEFVVQKSIYENDKIKIRRGDIIKARVSTIITSGMNGIPASIIFDSFEIKGIKPGQITNTLEIFGQDRTYFVFPLKWALTILPPTGSLTNFIKGGHVRLNTKKIFTLYYHPKWL